MRKVSVVSDYFFKGRRKNIYKKVGNGRSLAHLSHLSFNINDLGVAGEVRNPVRMLWRPVHLPTSSPTLYFGRTSGKVDLYII